MSRRSAQKKKALTATPSPTDDIPLVLEGDRFVLEVSGGEQAAVEEEEAAPPAPLTKSKKTKKSKKSKKSKRARDDEEEVPAAIVQEEEEEEEEGPVAAVDEEEEEAEAPAPEKKKKEKKEKRAIKRSEAGRAQGSRFESAKVYRTQLKKHRKEEDAGGQEEGKVKRKAKPGAIAKREVAFLSKANGLYLNTALVRRLSGAAIKKALPIIKAETARTAARLAARGKPIPHNLEVPDRWSISPGVTQILRGSTQIHMEKVADLGFVLREHAGRQTILARDIDLARAILKSK